MKLKLYLIMLVATTVAVAARAQDPTIKKQYAGADGMGNSSMRFTTAVSELMERNFFAPELLMQNQKAIGLTEEQQKSIRADVQKTMARFTELQWQQSAEQEAMMALIHADRPDEKAVLTQLDKLLSIEDEIKRLNAGLLIRMKNALTPEQQARLRTLKYKGTPLEKKLAEQPKPSR